MAARRMWLFVAVELAIYVAAAAALRAMEASWLSIAVVLVCTLLGARIALVLASFGYSKPRPTLSFHQQIGMIAAEVVSLFRFQLLIATHIAERAARDASQTAPLLVLVHGIYCNGGIWKPVIAKLRRSSNVAICAPSIEPPLASLAQQTEAFAEWLMSAARDRPVLIVAHSLGGLIARGALQRCGQHVRARLVCIGTPHAGTKIARALRSDIGRDLRSGSDALAIAQGAGVPAGSLNIRTDCDNLVVPASNAAWPEVENVVVHARGHLSLIYCREVLRLLRTAIEQMNVPTPSAFT